MSRKLTPKARLLLLALAVMMMVGPLSGCLVYGRGGRIVVGLPPPVFRAEVGIATPGPGYVWVPGYWDWRGAEWGWVGGAWLRPPHPHAIWVAPRYDRYRGGRWAYRRGYWR
jgi:hypothetical protein